jgi:hypothetical protein
MISVKDIIYHLITLVCCHDLIVSKVHQHKWNVHIYMWDFSMIHFQNLQTLKLKFPEAI